MGRAGVTYTEVDEAARYLQGQGRAPTIDALRERLGTGSRTTLAEHLKRWKVLQADSHGDLPQALFNLVTGLWDSLRAQAEKQVEENQAIAHQELLIFKTQLQAALQAETGFKRDLHALQEILDAVRREKLDLETQIQILERSQDKLTTLYQVNSKQLEEAKQENQRLHQLAGQIQNNLEHYQNSIQEQQIEQNLAREKQQIATTQELMQLKTALEQSKLQYEQSEKMLATHQLQSQQLQTEHSQLMSRYEQLLAKNEERERAFLQLQANDGSSKKHYSKIEQELLAERQLNQTFQQRIAVQADQLERTQIALHQAKDKIETLRQEKIFLIQEKAQLEGAFKQLRSG